MKTEIEVWHADDHRVYPYRWDPTIGRYVQQPGPGRPAVYHDTPNQAPAESLRRDMTRALEAWMGRLK